MFSMNLPFYLLKEWRPILHQFRFCSLKVHVINQQLQQLLNPWCTQNTKHPATCNLSFSVHLWLFSLSSPSFASHRRMQIVSRIWVFFKDQSLEYNELALHFRFYLPVVSVSLPLTYYFIRRYTSSYIDTQHFHPN